MSRSPPKMRSIAQRLNAYEAVQTSLPANAPAAFRVCEKLRRPLVKLVGSGGFGALLLRALALASVELRWLLSMQINVDGTLVFPPAMAQLGKKEVAEGEVALAARILELLVIVIGEPITLNLVRDIWPGAASSNFDSRSF